MPDGGIHCFWYWQCFNTVSEIAVTRIRSLKGVNWDPRKWMRQVSRSYGWLKDLIHWLNFFRHRVQPRLVFIPQRVWNRGQCWEGIQPSGAGATALPFFISANHVSKRTMFATHSTSTTSTTRYNSDHALLNKMQMRIATLASISLHGKSVCVFWRILRFLVASYAVRLWTNHFPNARCQCTAVKLQNCMTDCWCVSFNTFRLSALFRRAPWRFSLKSTTRRRLES